ncbi:MAG: outer membrane protein assembly factor, partial [Pseudomonadota bacterium]
MAKLLAASLALVLLCVFPANAFELFGRCFGSDCEKTIEVDEGIIDPRTYDVSVVLNNAVDPDLEDTIKSSSELWRGRQRAVGGSAGLLSRAKADYRRIQGALYLDGYFAGSISIRVNGQEVSDLELGTELPNRSSLVVTVDPGSVYRFGRFEIRNRAPSPIDENDFVKLPKGFAIQPGDIARAGQVRAAGNLVVEEWRQQGYPKARIVNREVSAVHSNRELNVLLEADPGSRAVFGELAASGAERVDEDFIAYMSGIERGKEYDPDEIAKAEKRLDRLDVFNLRKIEEAHAISADGELPLELKVKEKKPRRIGAGATVSSTDGLGLQGYWIHRNLFGRAERIRLEAEVGGIG